MKLFLVNDEYYILCESFSKAEEIYRYEFRQDEPKAVWKIEMVSTDVLTEKGSEVE